MTSIGSSAFYNCSLLNEVTIPVGITSIGSNAFNNSVKKIIFADGLVTIPSSACYGATNLTEVVIPNSVTKIDNEAFRGCTKLASVALPNRVTGIGNSAFSGCTSLGAFDIPSAVISIGSNAFYSCAALTEIIVPGGVTSVGDSAFRGCTNLTEVILQEGVVSTGSNTFYGCSALANAVLPSTLRTIGNSAFYNCKNLTSVVMSHNTSDDTVASIGSSAFYNCIAMATFDVPLSENVTIGSNAFYNCVISGRCGDNLTWAYDIAGQLLTIAGKGDMTFETSGMNAAPWHNFSSNIKLVLFSDELTSIADYAFTGCYNLKSVVIPDSVRTIGRNAFAGCMSLLRTEISSNLTSLGDAAFQDCDALNTVIFCGDAPSIGNNALPSDSDVTIYYPQSSMTWTPLVAADQTARNYRSWDDTLPTRDIALVLDCSGSMSGSRIAGLKTAVNAFINQTGGRLTNTQISIVSFTNSATVRTGFTTDVILAMDVINSLTANGGTTYVTALNTANSLLESSFADIKSIIFFSDGEPGDNTSSIYSTAATIRGMGYFVYTVGLCSSGTSYEQILINVAGSEKNYFSAENIDELVSLFVTIDNNIGDDNKTEVQIERDGNMYDLLTEPQSFEADSTDVVNIIVTPYWGSAVPGTVRITQAGKTIAENSSGNFSGLTPGQLFSPIETVFITLIDASGIPTAMIKTKLSVEVPSSSRVSASTGEMSITVYENKETSSSLKDNYVLSKGAKIVSNGVEYTTDTHGISVIPSLTSGTITVSKNGYITRIITAEQLEVSKKIYLQPTSYEGPVVSAVWVGTTDLLNSSYAIGLLSDQSITITAEVDWGSSSYGGIALMQDARTVKFTGNSLTTVLKDNFDVTEKIYIVATDAAGNTTKKALKFESGSVSAVPNILDGAGFSIKNTISITLPDNIKPDFFAGQKINVGVSSILPVTVSAEDGKVYVAIGVDLVSYSSSDKWATNAETGNRAHVLTHKTKTFIDKFKDTGILNTKGAASSLKKLKNLEQTYKTAIKYPQGSFGFDADFTILGFAEGYYDAQGNVTWLDGGIIFNPSILVSTNLPFTLGPIPMYFEASLSANIQAQLNIIFNEAAKNFTPNGQISGTVALSGGVGFGIKKVLYGGGGVEGKLTPDWKIYVNGQDYFKLTASVNAYAKVGIAFFEYKHSWDPFYNEVWVEYPQANAAKGVSLMSESGFYDVSSYEVKDLSYLDEASSFTANQMSDSSVMLMAVAPNPSYLTSSTLKTNIYRESTPQYVQLSDGTGLAVWLDSTNSNINGIQLYYSYFDGATWSNPAVVYNDGTLDYSPYLAVVNDIPYLVWQNATKTFTTSDSLETIAPYFDISIASYTPTTGFAVDTVSNPGLDMIPTICGNGSSLYAAWVNNGENDWLGNNSSNSILYSEFSDGAWSNPIAAYSGLSSVDALAADYNGGLRLAYSLDTDGDISTAEDARLYENGARVTTSSNSETYPSYFDHRLYWNSDGAIVSSSNEDQKINSIRDYQIVEVSGEKVIIYTSSNGLSSTLNASYLNKETEQWCEPYELTDGNSFIGAFSAAVSVDGTLRVLYNSQSVVGDYTDDDPYGASVLSMVSLTPYCDLKMGELLYNADEYDAGSKMEFSFDLTNNGSQVIENITVNVTDESGNVLSSIIVDDVLVPGQTITASTYFDVDASANGQTVSVTAIPTDYMDTNSSDNVQVASLSFEDLSIEDASCGKTEDDEVSVSASVVNRGYATRSNIIVELHKDGVDGTVVDTKTIASLDPLSLRTVSFTLSGNTGDVYYVAIKDSGDDFTANDSDFVSLASVETPFAEIDSISSTSAQLYLSNAKAGTCVVAVYDGNGKMLTAGTKTVGVEAGDVTITYNGFTADEHYTVKVFFVDQSYAPLYKAVTQEY